MEKVSIAHKLSLFEEHWSPRIVGDLNDHYVKLAKFQGEFIWHHHEHEDELFLVVSGQLLLRLRDRDIVLEPGEFAIIPRMVEHLPIAQPEAAVLLIEPKATLNTGNVKNDRTVEVLQRV